jgi:hypothetical protein
VRIAAVLVIAVLLVAVFVRWAFAASARHWLGFGFPGVARRPETAAIAFTHNVRALLAVAGLLLVGQSRYFAERPPGRVHRTVRLAGEALLGAIVAANVIVVGAGFGAYGARMVRAVLPHAPLELGAYVLALALYVEGRRRPLAARQIVLVGTMCVAALAFAAMLETYVSV